MYLHPPSLMQRVIDGWPHLATTISLYDTGKESTMQYDTNFDAPDAHFD
jgi:hypothetical protein